jgi:hypothetical protein
LETGVDFSYLQKEFERISPELCEIERKVLKLRFGLGGEKFFTLDEIASHLNISIPQIREIENHLLALVRHPSRSQVLTEYLKEDSFKTSNYDQVGKIISRSPIRGIFTSDFEAFFEDIFTIDGEENIINGIRINKRYIDEYFEDLYGHDFDPEQLVGESLYENLCKGYFSWSSEFDFLIELTLDKWINEDQVGLDMNFDDQPTWMDKVGFTISLISKILSTEPLDLAFNYMISAPRENYLTGLLSFDARAMLNHKSIAEDFLTRNLQINKALLPHISKASDQYATDYKNLDRDAESRVLFYLADLISRIYGLSRWGCTYENDAY